MLTREQRARAVWDEIEAGLAAKGFAVVPKDNIVRLAEAERLLPQMVAVLKLIRFNWGGHSEACANVSGRPGKCDCDWPMIAEKCDAALNWAGIFLSEGDE